MPFFFQSQPYLPPRPVGYVPILPSGGVGQPIWVPPPITPLRDVVPMAPAPILGREQRNERAPAAALAVAPIATPANAPPPVRANDPPVEALVPPVVPAEAPAAAMAPIPAEVEAQAQPPIVPPPANQLPERRRVIVRRVGADFLPFYDDPVFERNGNRLWGTFLLDEWAERVRGDPHAWRSRKSFVNVWKELEAPMSKDPKWPIQVANEDVKAVGEETIFAVDRLISKHASRALDDLQLFHCLDQLEAYINGDGPKPLFMFPEMIRDIADPRLAPHFEKLWQTVATADRMIFQLRRDNQKMKREMAEMGGEIDQLKRKIGRRQ